MRVLVSCGRTERLGPAEASDTVMGAFAGRGVQVVVAPVSGGRGGLAETLARFSPGARMLAVEDLRQAYDMLVEGPDYLGVTVVTAPELGELLGLPVTPVRAGITMVVPHHGAGRTLTGLTGLLAERDRETGADIAAALAEDSRATAWLERLGMIGRAPAETPCGPGAWALDCGTRVASGIRICVDGYRLLKLAVEADIIVMGTDVLDLHCRGGDVVAELTRLGVEALRPVVVAASRNFVSSRGLRLVGIEEAHAVAPPRVGEIDITTEQLEALAQRVAGTWAW